MTTNDAFERNLSIWLHEDAEHHVPDHLEEVLQRTAAARQRPAWSSLERWLPVDTTFRRSVFARPTCRCANWRSCSLIGLLIAALVASLPSGRVDRRPRRSASPATATSWPAATATSTRSIRRRPPRPSIDRRRRVRLRAGLLAGRLHDVLFLRSAGPMPTSGPAMLSLMVANADGSRLPGAERTGQGAHRGSTGLRAARRSRTSTTLAASPSSTSTAPGPTTSGRSAGPPLRDLAAARRLRDPVPGRAIETSDPAPGIFAVRPGRDRPSRHCRRSRRTTTSISMGVTAAPDGSRVSFRAFHVERDRRRSWYSTSRSGEETALPHPPGASQRGEPSFSPDGTLVAYSRIYDDGTYQLVVAPADGTSEGAAIGPTDSRARRRVRLGIFTPDGTGRARRYGPTTIGATRGVIPLDGSPGTVISEGGSFELRRHAASRALTIDPQAAGHALAGCPAVPRPRGYNRAMAHRVTLIPGDGIGPELAEASRRVLDATGIAFEWEVVDAGEAVMAEYGTPAPGARPGVGHAQQGRPQGPDHDAGRRGLPQRQRDAPPGARAVRQPAPGALDAGASSRATRTSISSSSARTPRTCTPGSSTWSVPTRRRASRSSPVPPPSGSRGSPSTTRSPTAGARSRPCTRPTS